jgi:polysaccharide export outer membrane protein
MLLLLPAISGCALLPASGPADTAIRNPDENTDSLPHAFVRVTPKVIEILAATAPRLTQFASQQRPRDVRFGIGDTVAVTIFEASSGGLFIPSEAGVRPGNFVNIPNQAVDTRGNISVPYAGNIRALGRTKEELQQAIVDALKNRAIEPQVVVSTVDQRTSLVTVLGEVGHTGRIPASAAPERVLDYLARAGGTQGAASETWIMLERKGIRASAPLGALIYEAKNNVYVHADDTLFFYREPQTFLAFGALGRQAQVPFGAWRVSLAEAVSKAGGLIDQQSDPASVFLYRGETCEVARTLEIDCSRYPGALVPVIYNINFRDPASFFLASKFEMRNKDVIYVTNSTSVEVGKFVAFLRTLNNAIQDPVQTGTSIYGLKNLIQGTGSSTILNVPTPLSTAAPVATQ